MLESKWVAVMVPLDPLLMNTPPPFPSVHVLPITWQSSVLTWELRLRS